MIDVPGERCGRGAGGVHITEAAGDGFSPPCALDEAGLAWRGLASEAEVRDLLADLLAARRAAARAVAALRLPGAPAATRAALAELARSEGCCCVLLAAQLRRYGGDTAEAPGDHRAWMGAAAAAGERLALLERGQARAVRRIEAALPRIADPELLAALRWMRRMQSENRRCSRDLAAAGDMTGLTD